MFHFMPSSSAIHQNATDVELRSRNSKNGVLRLENESPSNRVIINHKILPGETLNSIALYYSISISEIKRANGLVSDQEIFALSSIKIPLSRLQRDILISKSKINYENHTNDASSSNINFNLLNYQEKLSIDENLNNFSTKALPESSFSHQNCSIINSVNEPLLNNNEDDDSLSSINESDVNIDSLSNKKQNTKQAIEIFFEKTDANVAAVRENLYEKTFLIEGGGFHFIDAKAPDNNPTKGVWLLIASVIIFFVFIPLFFTLMEEQHEAEMTHLHQIATENLIVMNGSFNSHKKFN